MEIQEEALKAGVIIDYNVYIVQNPRTDESDVIPGQKYRNMAISTQRWHSNMRFRRRSRDP